MSISSTPLEKLLNSLNMSLALLHRQCSREMNAVGPLLSPEITSEISHDSEEDKPGQNPSNQACSNPPVLPTRSGSVTSATAAAAPPWLLATLADLNEKMGMLAINSPKQDDTGETFAERAESYYQKRPQLLAFLQDLYRAYISLSDRYVQLLSKNNQAHHSCHPSQVSTITTDNDCSSLENDRKEDLSDAESCLSFQFQQPLRHDCSPHEQQCDFDNVVAEVVMKNVECDILLHEVEISGSKSNDASRKIELQRSLLEVLESERLILLSENARLGYRVGALIEENHLLASESAYVKRKAGELARCLLKKREDQRVCGLSRKIEDLQEQIYKLEKRNREYYEQLVRRGETKGNKKGRGGSSSREVALEVCFQMERFKLKPSIRAGGGERKVAGWWEKVKKMDLFMCGMMQT